MVWDIMETKRQVLPPGLWVVATPIGNLEEMSPRARAALEQAEILLCEDTRRTLQLIQALGLQVRGKLARWDAHRESQAKLEEVLSELSQNHSHALVSDAGTPGVSDPGARLIRAALQRGIRVLPIAGPSAVSAFYSVSGLSGEGFCFRGFFPRKEKERIAELVSAQKIGPLCSIWFESPERISESLALIARERPQAELTVAKELTKIHERIFSGSAAQVFSEVSGLSDLELRGEWCFGIVMETEQAPLPSEWELSLRCLIDAGVGARESSRLVGRYFSLPQKEIYSTYLKLKKK